MKDNITQIKFIVEQKDGRWYINDRTFKDMTEMEREALDKFIKSYDSERIFN